MPIPVATAPTMNQIYPPLVANQANAFAVGLNAQSGAAVLAAGTVTVSGVTLTATSVIMLSRKTAGGTAGAGGVMAPSGSRTVGGAGSFVINAVDLTGALVATDTSTLDWLVIG
jgi:hypothetical protein